MQRRIALLECEDAKKWEGYTDLLWKEALSEPDDYWALFKACEGHLPTPEEAAQFDAVIVAGSHYSAYEEHDWIQKLLDLLPKLASQGTRMYGCCFGCQILARALGGSVGPNPDGDFVLTIEQVQPVANLKQYPMFHAAAQQALAAAAATEGSNSVLLGAAALTVRGQRASAGDEAAAAAAAGQLDGLSLSPSVGTAADAADTSPGVSREQNGGAAAAAAAVADAVGHAAAHAAAAGGCFRLIESHGDQVLQLPPGATLLATSATATNELWCWGDNILASQFHVEFDEPLVLEKIWSSLKDVGRLNVQQAEDSRHVLEAGGQMNAAMLQLIKHFLKHGIDKPAAADGRSTDNNSSTDSKAVSCSKARGDSSSTTTAGAAGSSTDSRSDSRHQSTMDSTTGDNSCSAEPAAVAAAAATAAAAPVELTATGAQDAALSLQPPQQQQQQYTQSSPSAGAAAAEAPLLHNAGSTGSTLLPPPSATAPENPTWPPYLGSNFSIRADRNSKSLTEFSEAQRSECSSPTAASEHSVAASITSTSSAVPFSHIAYQRKQQRREVELHHSAAHMINDASAAFDLRMDGYSLDLEALQQLNATAADQYMVTAEIAVALGQFAQDLGSRQAAVREALAALPQIDRQLKILQATVTQLDKRSRDLEANLGLSGSSSSGKSAYEYLASSFSRAGSTVGGAGAGGCLSGGALPKQFD